MKLRTCASGRPCTRFCYCSWTDPTQTYSKFCKICSARGMACLLNGQKVKSLHTRCEAWPTVVVHVDPDSPHTFSACAFKPAGIRNGVN